MGAFYTSDKCRVVLPPRRLTTTIQSVREAAVRNGVDIENEYRSHGVAEWSYNLAWIDAMKETLGLTEAEEACLKDAFRERNQAIWGDYADVGEE